MKRFWQAAVFIGLALSTSTARAGLDIGDPAPKLEVTEWVKGKPVDLAQEKGKGIVVVEFWATWCQPCVATIPHLTELQKHLGPKGVTIVGVTAEDPDNTLDQVKEFVKQRNDSIGYAIAFDKPGKMNEAYPMAANEQGIPTAFVVDREGRVAWIGHPLAGLDTALEEIIAGKYDVNVAKKLRMIMNKMQEAYYSEDWSAALAGAEEIIALKPTLMDGWDVKISILSGPLNRPDEAASAAKQATTHLNDRPRQLAGLASRLMSLEGKEFRDLAVQVGKRASEAAPNDPEVRVAYFEVLAGVGQHDQARQWAVDALPVLKSDPMKSRHFAELLSSQIYDGRYLDLALQSIEQAIAAQPEEPRNLQTRFNILFIGKKDTLQAQKVGDYIVEKAGNDAGFLNEFAWVLLTEEPFAGKFNHLALKAAQRCHELSKGENWMYLDTLALAKFNTGAKKEAIELEKRAIELCPNEQFKRSLQESLHKFESGAD